MKEKLIELFKVLDNQIQAENSERRVSGSPLISQSRIEILGQTSLLIQPKLTYGLSLAQTGDLDALLKADNFVRQALKKLLPTYGFIYDEDSPLIFVPKGSQFLPFLNLSMLVVVVIDPESALVSKAVKAPEKNTQLIRQAIASDNYPNLVDRIVKSGGDLKKFT